MFGNNLRKYRLIKGYSQSEFANKLYVTRQCVSKWEQGITQPDMETLVKISELLGVSVDTLLKNDESESKEVKTDLNKVFLIVNILVALFCAIAFVALWRFLPSSIPAHWSNGQIDRYGDSVETFLHLMTVVVFLAVDVILFVAFRKDFYGKIIVVVHCIIVFCQIAYLVFIIALYAKYLTTVLSFAACLSASLLLCVSTAMHPKISKQNQWLGVRTSGTLSSTLVWNKTNALACYLFVGVSLAIIIVNMCVVSVWSCIGFVAYVISTIIVLIYSKSISSATNEDKVSK